MATRAPPRFVPTLTEVVQAPPVAAAPAPPARSEEEWVRRIMKRVDDSLERRVREAVASVVLEQTRALAPLLRDRVEEVVREAVAQALAEELASAQAKPRA